MPATVKSFRDLIVWQKAMAYVECVYTASRAFPADEQFGLTNQLRRAAVSIPSNIAEGHGRQGTQDFIKFLRYAHGSLNETRTQLELAARFGYITTEAVHALDIHAAEIERILHALIKSLEAKR